MKSKLRVTLAVLSLLSAGAQAAEIIVTPANLGTEGVMNQWYLTNFRDVSNGRTSHTTAAITDTQARSGNGSVEMSLTDGSGKADYAYTWGYVEGRTLGNLKTLSYDWQRAGGGSADPRLAPALRLVYDADGDIGTKDDLGYLIFEQVYNDPFANSPVPTDLWVSSNIIDANFWMRQVSKSNTVESYNISLAEWIAGAHPSDMADRLSADSAILGLEFGIGSGWNGSFTGYVDNVSFGFGNRAATTFNFETETEADVPEPGSLALLGLGLMGVCLGRRRKV
jgi:hypothetical protein